MQVRPFIMPLLIVSLTGCAVYRAKPLPTQPNMSQEVPHITIDASRMPFPELATHRFDPSDGLDMTEVAMLAVVNNPDLRIARDEAGIASAQAFAAGLLPDPQLNASVAFPTNDIPGSTYTAYSFGLSYDIGALLARSSTKAAAAAGKRRTDLNLLWQEWQVVAQARLLFIRNMEQNRLKSILREYRDLLAARYAHGQQALRDGNATLDAVSTDFSALQDMSRQINELERQQSQNKHDLNALLGLAPEVTLQLVGESQLSPLDTKKIVKEAPTLAARRPDLLALKAGYESEDAHLRQAIIAQFPAPVVGLTRSRDNTDVHSIGIGITMNLPLFNRNRGNVAIEEATRQRLYDEYQARLNAAWSEIHRILEDQVLLERQIAGTKEDVANAERAAVSGEAAYKGGNITEPAYLALRGALLGKRLEEITLEQKILEQRVALLTLCGGEAPTAGSTTGGSP